MSWDPLLLELLRRYPPGDAPLLPRALPLLRERLGASHLLTWSLGPPGEVAVAGDPALDLELAEGEALVSVLLDAPGVPLDLHAREVFRVAPRLFRALRLRGAGLVQGVVMAGRWQRLLIAAGARDRLLHEVRVRRVLIGVSHLVALEHDGATSAPSPPARLTPREREIVGLVCKGLTNAQIALACGSSPLTVRNQLSNIYRRLEVASRAELAAAAAGWRAQG